MPKIKIALLFGGCSEEHDVSVKSAREMASKLDLDRYEPSYIYITRTGAWKLCEEPNGQLDGEACPSAMISPSRETHGLLIGREGKFEARRIDLVFPVIHGKTGEDGTIQGLLELSGIPYIGCGVQSSVLCMDKALAHEVVRGAGVATPDFWVLAGDELPETDPWEFPVFVKPARSGSSFGITKVAGREDLLAAIRQAGQFDSKVMVERAILGSEVGCAVLGEGAALTVGEVDQIELSHGHFRIHQEARPEAGSENATIRVPANLPGEKRRQIQETAKKIYRALGCKGLARVDMFLQRDGAIVFNEVNTMPGFTSYSRYPRMMAAAGMPMCKLIDRLAALVLEGGEE